MIPFMDGTHRAARAVAARRGELAMTQQELAAAAGVDSKTIYNLESRGRWPIARTRASIEKALDWPSGELDRLASPPDSSDEDAIDRLERSAQDLLDQARRLRERRRGERERDAG